MVREGSADGKPPNSTDFMAEFGISRRTVARDLDFLRDEERAPLEYDDARHGFRLVDETYALPPMTISRREAFSFGLARKLLAHYEGTPLHLDMRSVLDKIAESMEGDITIEPDWLSEHVGVLPEDRVRILKHPQDYLNNLRFPVVLRRRCLSRQLLQLLFVWGR